MTIDLHTSSTPIVPRYQRNAFERLMRIVRTARTLCERKLPITPKLNFLLAGPSGGGKSHMVRTVAEESGCECLCIASPQWMPLGASGRGSEITWIQIARTIDQLFPASKQWADTPFLIIFLDEFDKLVGSSGPNSWEGWGGYLKSESMRLLDRAFPVGIRDVDDEPWTGERLARMDYALRHRTMIVAAGAFQNFWNAQAQPNLGFAVADSPQEFIGLADLATTLPRELTHRLCAEIVVLPELSRSDYEDILLSVAERLPETLQQPFMALGELAIPDALKQRTGFRFAEELLLKVLMQESGPERPKPVAEPIPETIKWKHHPREGAGLTVHIADPLAPPEAL